MGVSREVFEQQCKRRFGVAIPERMRLAHWEWMVRSGDLPFWVRDGLGLEMNDLEYGPRGSPPRRDPDWCFSRFGMSRTVMPDGRIICISGEHSDDFDPDFCIYNDVIVLRPEVGRETVDLESGEVEIYGYPEDVFAPTDFHSATLVGDRIYIIGRLGYGGARIEGATPILCLDTSTYEIAQVAASGPAPGWIYKHHASFDEARGAIVVRGGEVWKDGVKGDTPHLGAHRLHLDGMRWEVIALEETHRRFLIERFEGESAQLEEATGDSFRPANVSHRWLPPEEQGVWVYRLDVAGVRVSFAAFYDIIKTHVEGDLPGEVVDQIFKDVVANLERDTKLRWRVREVKSFGLE